MGAVDKLRTAPGLVRALGSALPRAAKMTSARARHDPREPHWHIGPIGVHPDHQGQGVGSALLSPFLAEVDTEHAATFLETDVDRNEVLYERFGFHTVTREEILGVDTRFMWRAPASPDA
jgi:GNAT superfamily N-acetyltransferase